MVTLPGVDLTVVSVLSTHSLRELLSTVLTLEYHIFLLSVQHLHNET